jgi:hypothetical protein
MNKESKMVSFNDMNDIYTTYSSDEYCRHQINSTKLKFDDRKIPPQVWKSIFIQLDIYKLKEMQVHDESRMYTRFHCKNQHLLF